MNRLLARGEKLVLASHNPGKLREIRDLLDPYGVEVVSAADLGLPEPEETEPTFAGNARIKSVAAATRAGLPALSDDSGLEVAALGAAPGVHSARWAGPARDFAAAMRKVEEALATARATTPEQRRANFTAVLSLARPDGTSLEFEGKVFGTLVWPPRGDRGFGYDPVFVPVGYAETFGEMAPERKHRISHRAMAFRKFVEACLG
jgi:XTP/dITP diphosphohydrolase